MSHRVLVILSPGFEEVEAVTVIDILRRAKIDTTTASLEDNAAVLGSHGILVAADRTLDEIKANDYSCLVLPGGLRGVENMLKSAAVAEIIRSIASAGGILAAVCAAPLLLDAQNLLDAPFTCHPCVYDRLKSAQVQDIPACTSGNIVTGRSAGCAMSWALELVAKLIGECPEQLLAGLRLP